MARRRLHARCKAFGQNRTEQGCGKYQNENDIEHPIVQQPLAGRVERLMRNQRGCKCSGDLRKRERPDRQLVIEIVSICAAHKPRGRPFARQQGGYDTRNDQKIVENLDHEFHGINQKAGNEEEDRNKQRLAEKLKLGAGRRFARRSVDRKPRKKRAYDAGKLDCIREEPSYRHEDNRAGEVIHRLRHLLKKGERKLESVNINDLVRSTAALLNSELIGRETGVGLDLENRLLLVTGDSVQLQQVLLNLVMNAMDAMASTPLAQRIIQISTRGLENGLLEVMVKDRGHGIRPLENGHLFEPFYTTKSHGLGLGLTICSTIVEAHGGRLTLANREGGGAIAGFSLPTQTPLVDAA